MKPPETEFTEPVALSSTQPADLPVSRTALELSFDLIALRARCKGEATGRAWTGQETPRVVARNLRTISAPARFAYLSGYAPGVRVSVGDVDLHVHTAGPETGEGRPLVALHGGPGLDGSTWFPGLTPLAEEGWRILAPDLRGNGRSDAGYPSRWTVPQMADDVEVLIRELGLDEVVVMGQSFGSFVAQAHMARHGTASAYVLMGTVAEPGALEGIDAELERFMPVHLRAQVTASWMCEASVQTAEEARQLWHDQIPFHVADPEGPLVAWLVENDEIVFRPEVLRHFAAGGDYGMADLRGVLHGFRKPVLVLSGERDRTTSPASAHALAELLPYGEEAVIRDAAHLALYERPEETLAALRSFLARV